MPATAAWLASLEALLNRSLEGSSRAADLTRQLRGQSFEIDVRGWMRIRVAASDGRLALLAGGDGPTDAVISGSPLALLRVLEAGSTPSGGSLPAAGGTQGSAAVISGDAEIANRYRQLLQLARPDLEEELARWIGDFPARRVSLLAQGALDFLRRAGAIARDNIAEYLQEESRDLVNRTELEEFLRAVDEAREAADRIGARLARLEARTAGGPA